MADGHGVEGRGARVQGIRQGLGSGVEGSGCRV